MAEQAGLSSLVGNSTDKIFSGQGSYIKYSHLFHMVAQIELITAHHPTYDSDISLRSALELPAGPAVLLRLLTPSVEVTGWGGDMCRDL